MDSSKLSLFIVGKICLNFSFKSYFASDVEITCVSMLTLYESETCSGFSGDEDARQMLPWQKCYHAICAV